MTVTYPLRLFLDCSTAHLSLAARAYLQTDDALASPTPYGWFVYASEEPGERVPSDLAQAMAYARSLGAEYINFDRDALEIARLPEFEWAD